MKGMTLDAEPCCGLRVAGDGHRAERKGQSVKEKSGLHVVRCVLRGTKLIAQS